ncbi:maleylpyruvate isomerase family mycothiol-dependent enzyme [Streptomyces lincolnensis]|uniref:maleylpyruvate isomerase family mycothiol-dependent enzyme n=1 Tax=Streptomyces lincolnensis TaxID=1915 RepID=UPI001E611B36|nr:maleylpyruvate isomerase family mycothiol-dependent enzyme [Streptomyces lincolnensis]MCD7439377.1 maleylpyruvate isomerase family mycothiol-dependent enzyme [Streptomyces lincolnensis]
MGVTLETDELWKVVDRERASLADLLESLSPEEWETRTRCGDWRVRDVAAHLTIAARFTYGQVVREMTRARGNWNRMIHDSAVGEARLPVAEITANLRSTIGSRRLAPTTSPREPLLDLLVHGQDIALALGRTRQMPPEAARDAADRVWTMRFPPRPWPLPKARLVATDIAWARGEGEEIRGPIAALLLLLTGRPEAAREWCERAGEPWTGVAAPR